MEENKGVLRDPFGTPIEVGTVIVYPQRQSSGMWLNAARVEGMSTIEPGFYTTPRLMVRPICSYGRLRMGGPDAELRDTDFMAQKLTTIFFGERIIALPHIESVYDTVKERWFVRPRATKKAKWRRGTAQEFLATGNVDKTDNED